MHILTVSVSEPALRREAWFIHRADLKAVALGLLLIVTATAGTAAQAERPIGEILARRTEEYMSRNIASVLQTRALQLRGVEAPLFHPFLQRRLERFYWGGCGGGHSDVVEPRVTKLPSDPILVLGDGYLKCRMIRAAVLEPVVSVASYPPGYFGDYEYEGLLVADWLEFSDEVVLQQLFTLLAAVAQAPDDELEFYEWDDQELKLADYRKNTGFFPELVFEFIGAAPLKIEINQTFGRLLILAGNKWDGYSVDKSSAAELRTLLEAKLEETGGNRHFDSIKALSGAEWAN